jgi:hypothetical protein
MIFVTRAFPLNLRYSFAAPLSPTMKKYLNIDIAGNSRPQSSQSTHVLPVTRPTSSLASAPSKWEETRPRPATSMAHHRSTSSSVPATKSSTAMALKPTCSEAEPIITPNIRHSAAGPSSKNRDNMPPPAIVPQRRQQAQSEPQPPPEHPGIGRPQLKVAARPQEACSSKTATQVLRPDSIQTFAPMPKQYAGPLRAEAMSVKGPQRVLLPEAQRPAAPPKTLLTSQETRVSAEVEVVFRR